MVTSSLSEAKSVMLNGMEAEVLLKFGQSADAGAASSEGMSASAALRLPPAVGGGMPSAAAAASGVATCRELRTTFHRRPPTCSWYSVAWSFFSNAGPWRSWHRQG